MLFENVIEILLETIPLPALLFKLTPEKGCIAGRSKCSS